MAVKKRPIKVVFMLSEDEAARLDHCADKMDETRSRVIRLALDSFVDKRMRDETRRSADACRER